MAKNREPESEPEESEESDAIPSSESGSETDSESNEESPPPKSATHPVNLTPQNLPLANANSSVSESLSGSDSGSDSESSESGTPAKKPDPAAISPAPPLKTKSNPTSSVQISPVRGSAVGVKRGAGKLIEEAQDGKKPKKTEALGKKEGKSEGASDSVMEAYEDSSKKMFQRVFSEDDEVGLLKGMLDFMAKRKCDPVANIDEFLDFIKKLLNLDVTRAQLLNKIRRLKRKYKNNASKAKDGHEVKISKQHERESYELSKKIWGLLDAENNNIDGGLENTKVNGSVVKKGVNKNAGAKVTVAPKLVNDDKVASALAVNEVNDNKKLKHASSGVTDGVSGLPVYSALEQRIMTEEIKNADKEKQRELEKKLGEIEVAELELCAKRCEYMAEKARLLIAAKKAEL